MASISGYRSPVDLGIAQIPVTTDPALFDEFTEVYNAIHLLNSSLDKIRFAVESGGSGNNPAEQMPFSRTFIGVALQAIEKDQPVSPNVGSAGIALGALPHDNTSTEPECNFCGIAVTSAEVGETVRVGVGPAALKITGAVPGQLIWAYPNRSTTGNLFGEAGLYLSNPGSLTKPGVGIAYAVPVAIGIAPDYAIFGKFIKRP